MEYYRIRKAPKYTKKDNWQVFINRTGLCWEYLKEFGTLKEAKDYIKQKGTIIYNKRRVKYVK